MPAVEELSDLRVRVGQHVVRARIEVEVEGDPQDIAAVFDGLVASVARHFPDGDTAPAEEEEAATQDVDEIQRDRTQDVVSPAPEALRRAA